MFTRIRRRSGHLLAIVIIVGTWLCSGLAIAEDIQFQQETLSNGLQVIYVPLHQAPVVHVRVLYKVGSRDERPDRTGFAHMFEHMMFRGSAHVKPEQHMKLISDVGGNSNAFTTLDRTVYVNTVPANQLDLALYLEADRLSSFRVSEEIYQTERKVVGEERGRKLNQPYGFLSDEFFSTVYTTHPYRWTPIGKAEHLLAAHASELQEFFNKYYVPNNAILVIAGDFDDAAARASVAKYFGWIPGGADVQRNIPAEPVQTEARRRELIRPVPLAMVRIGYHGPAYRDADTTAVDLLTTILGGGASSRLHKRLVSSENPLASEAQSGLSAPLDPGIISVTASVLAGKDADEVEKILLQVVEDVIQNGVTQEELDKAKTLARISVIAGRKTAEDLAEQVGDELLLTGTTDGVNKAIQQIDAVTLADIQAAARKYLVASNSSTIRVTPGPRVAANKEAPATSPATAAATAPAVDPATSQVATRNIVFPENYPTTPPVADAHIKATFNKGQETSIDGVRTLVFEDHRLPLVGWSLVLRSGSHTEPVGKEGLAGITAGLLRRGFGSLTYEQINEDLESRGISLRVSDGGDITTISGSCTTDQLEHAITRTVELIHQPTFPESELAKIKTQVLNQIRVSRESPTSAAGDDLTTAIYGDSPLGRITTPESVRSITLEDIKAYYARVFSPTDAFLVIHGDVSQENAAQLAHKLLDNWASVPLTTAEYSLPPVPQKRQIILIDRPESKQAVIRLGIRAYGIDTDEKFAGSIAGRILSQGIDSRLGRYVRAQKGLAYSASGTFSPGRHGGAFSGGTETDIATTAEAVEAMFKVFDDMAQVPVTDIELSESKVRVAGGMVMSLQTIEQQASQRIQQILNGYPIDYYDRYSDRIAEVTAQQVQQVMQKYVDTQRITIVIVAPAAIVKPQLDRLGDVTVVPMPSKRTAPTTAPAAPETNPATTQPLKPAA